MLCLVGLVEVPAAGDDLFQADHVKLNKGEV